MFRFLVISLMAGLFLIIACGESGQKETGDTGQSSDSLTVTVMGETGKSILEVTIAHHAVEMVESSMGIFVKGIDSIQGGGGYAWFISVNDKMIHVAADKYITEDNDIIKWHFRKL